MRRVNGRWRFLVLLLLAPAGLPAQQQYDVIIRGGRVLDGTGNPWRLADIAVSGDRIAAVGDLARATAARTLDARGLYVAPGFIDPHSHAGEGLATPQLSGGDPLLAQGITTVFVNPDGSGPVDLAAQRQQLERNGLGPNVALMVPHGSVRDAVLGMADRAPSAAELEKMKALVRAGMEAGAYGLSSGPYYAPGSFAKTEELIELSKIAASYGGVYTSHIRDESDFSIGLIASVDEVIRIAREAQLPGIVTHVKALGPRVWGFSQAVVQRIERARDQGVQVYADQYPYEASQTGLAAALLPRWAQAGGTQAFEQRLADAKTLATIKAEMAESLDRRGGADRIQIASYPRDRGVEGKTLEQIARERRKDPIDQALEMMRDGGEARIVSFSLNETDITTLMRQPWVMTSTDGGLVPMGEGVPHPRAYGTYPRKLRRYVVEQQVIDLGFAIRSMTSLPAAVFGVTDRGAIRTGMMADLVVFDLARVRDRATYQQPHQLAEGLVHVLINGRLAIDGERLTTVKSGRVLGRESR
jgi:N-acyl-D-aspartate/D-glutamate deacylase